MIPGNVVTIRVEPEDCMAVADIVSISGVHIRGMSFSAAVSQVLKALLEYHRLNGNIPKRTGFDYEEVMQPFADKSKGGKKSVITASLRNKPVQSLTNNDDFPRYQELMQKVKAGHSGIMTEAEILEYSQLSVKYT